MDAERVGVRMAAMPPIGCRPRARSLAGLEKTGPAALNALQRKGEWQKIGRHEHRDASCRHFDAFCRHCKETYAEYDPQTLPWSELDDKALKRLRAAPATACGRAPWSPRPPWWAPSCRIVRQPTGRARRWATSTARRTTVGRVGVVAGTARGSAGEVSSTSLDRSHGDPPPYRGRAVKRHKTRPTANSARSSSRSSCELSIGCPSGSGRGS